MPAPDYFAGTHLIECDKCRTKHAASYMTTLQLVGWRQYNGGAVLCWLCPACDRAAHTLINTWLASEN